MVKISIIIPIYNGEVYLEKCIRNVLCQTIKELEILCVDDGSTDGSAQIVRDFSRKDSRVILLQQENAGPGPARNLAIQKAKGEYVAFLDADDYYLDVDALEKMAAVCEAEKVLICGSREIGVRSEDEKKYPMFQEETVGKVLNYIDYQMDYCYQNYVIQRNLLVENHIYFPNYRRYQDPPFFVKALYFAEKFSIADTCLYCYRVSDIRSKFNPLKTADMLTGMLDNLKFAEENALDLLFETTTRRLEYEFAEIICENVSFHHLNLLELLMEANNRISIKNHKPNYVIRPLKMLLFSEKQYEDELLTQIEQQESISIYGAGKFGKEFLFFLKSKGQLGKVKNIIVSDRKGNVSQVEGISVIELKEFLETKSGRVFVAVGGNYKREITNSLEEKGYTDFEIVEEIFLEKRQKLISFDVR